MRTSGQTARSGSSPRVRGTGAASGTASGRTQYIPACAGNRKAAATDTFRRAVHPRVCGEQPRSVSTRWASSGSSPRVRGTGPGDAAGRRARRFIPACAGNSGPAGDTTRRAPVHPRVCGEQVRPVRLDFSAIGSSPRVRGTAVPDDLDGGVARFIPACAGNRRPIARTMRSAPVHPRVCGEQMLSSVSSASSSGSSPRVRGTAIPHRTRMPRKRFIPACAGNRSRVRARGWWATVHPRVCGEQSAKPGTDGAVDGSSPRVRGTVV